MNLPAMNIEPSGSERPEDAAAQLVSHYRRIAGRLPGEAIEAIRKMREDAIAAFAEKGLPHRRVEEWKYTDLRRLINEAYAPAEAQETEVTAAQIDEALGGLANLDATKWVFVNGHFSQDLSTPNDVPSGVELMSLAKALYAPADWVLAALGKVNPQENETVALLNTAFMTDGFVLHLPKGAKLARPLHIIHVTCGEEPVAASLRNLIVAGEEAEASIIESYVSLGAAAQTNSVIEVKAAPGAKIRHYKVSGENTETQHLSSVMADLAERSDYLAVNFADGAALSRHQTFLKFNGDDAKGHYYGAQLLTDGQHCDMTLVINHDAVGCESREHVKAVLGDKAHGVFQAKVMVRPDAQKTDGRQMSQALLLSDTAEFDAKPELEIFADDVKCNHGATFGAIDEDLMFYLRARGIPEDQARSLLIQAFVGEVVEPVEDEALREVLIGRIAGWLG